jgi:hypothetical protein
MTVCRLTLHFNKAENIQTKCVSSLQDHQNIDRSVRNATLMRKYAVILTGCLAGGSARCSTSTQLKKHLPSHLCSSIRRRCERCLSGNVRVDNALVAAVTPKALRLTHLAMDLRLAARRHDETRPAASAVRLAARLSVLLPGNP